MAHQGLHRPQIIPISRCEGVPHHMGMNPLPDQNLFTTDRMRQSTDLCEEPFAMSLFF